MAASSLFFMGSTFVPLGGGQQKRDEQRTTAQGFRAGLFLSVVWWRGWLSPGVCSLVSGGGDWGWSLATGDTSTFIRKLRISDRSVSLYSRATAWHQHHYPLVSTDKDQ